MSICDAWLLEILSYLHLKIILIGWLCKYKIRYFICHNIFLNFKYFRFQTSKSNSYSISTFFSYFRRNSKFLWLPFLFKLICCWTSANCCFFSSSIFSFLSFNLSFVFLFEDFLLKLIVFFLGIFFNLHSKKIIPN